MCCALKSNTENLLIQLCIPLLIVLSHGFNYCDVLLMETGESPLFIYFFPLNSHLDTALSHDSHQCRYELLLLFSVEMLVILNLFYTNDLNL